MIFPATSLPSPRASQSSNDKTIIRYAGAVGVIREDPTYTEKTCVLYKEDGTVTEYTGNNLPVDNW